MSFPSEFSRRLIFWIRATRLRSKGVILGPGYRLAKDISARLGEYRAPTGAINVGFGSWFEQGVCLHAFGGRIDIGNTVFLGPYTVIYGHGGVSIGDDCLIGMHSRILSSNHTIAPMGSLIRTQPDVLLPTKIGRDVWLGAGVTVLGGVSIGDGCIVGAGAIVTKDLPSGSIAYGIPAEIRGWRDGARPASQ